MTIQSPAERAKALSANFLRKELYVIRTRPLVPHDKLQALLPEHLEHQIRLEKTGVMFAAGPLFDEAGNNVGGQVIVRAKSFDEARAIADADPFHRAGLRAYTVERWSMNEGRITITLDYSDRSMKID
jgi:uncharacterized protein YciI